MSAMASCVFAGSPSSAQVKTPRCAAPYCAQDLLRNAMTGKALKAVAPHNHCGSGFGVYFVLRVYTLWSVLMLMCGH